MLTALRAKFGGHPQLTQLLLDTGTASESRTRTTPPTHPPPPHPPPTHTPPSPCRRTRSEWGVIVCLVAGSRRLVEHTANDSYWGDGGDSSGQNRLGALLMQVRDEIAHSAAASGGGAPAAALPVTRSKTTPY